MTDFERAECKAYLEKQIKRLSISLEYADGHKNNEQEMMGLLRKLRVHRNLLEMVEGETRMKEISIRTNAEWLEFISDLEDLACFLCCEKMKMNENAELVDKAIELLIRWNPECGKSIKKCKEGDEWE